MCLFCTWPILIFSNCTDSEVFALSTTYRSHILSRLQCFSTTLSGMLPQNCKARDPIEKSIVMKRWSERTSTGTAIDAVSTQWLWDTFTTVKPTKELSTIVPVWFPYKRIHSHWMWDFSHRQRRVRQKVTSNWFPCCPIALQKICRPSLDSRMTKQQNSKWVCLSSHKIIIFSDVKSICFDDA